MAHCSEVPAEGRRAALALGGDHAESEHRPQHCQTREGGSEDGPKRGKGVEGVLT